MHLIVFESKWSTMGNLSHTEQNGQLTAVFNKKTKKQQPRAAHIEQIEVSQSKTKSIPHSCKREKIHSSFTIRDGLVPITINVNIHGRHKSEYKFNGYYTISIPYSSKVSINDILKNINTHLNKKHDPIALKMTVIYEDDSFVKEDIYIDDDADQHLLNDSVTIYSRNEIRDKGLNIQIAVNYEHKVKTSQISCQHMIDNNTNNPLHCPIYYSMKQNYEWNQENLNHLNEFTHFADEFNEKPVCKFNDECKTYIRLENGDCKVNDMCHMKLYKHPPRGRTIELAQNINCLAVNKAEIINEPLHTPTYFVVDGDVNGYLDELVEEVIINNFKYDLCLQCRKGDDCKHNEHSILQIVDSKLQSQRHKKMNSPLRRDHMLALLLYTGCDCNYDLCSSQRSGDYIKWKWLDLCLYWAIVKLSECESGSFSVFSGLNKVKLDEKEVNEGYFVTYVSTSWNKEIASAFMKKEGMLIQIDKDFKEYVYCCDVSWISKFPDECEILFARSTDMSCQWDGFKCVVLDESNGVQTIGLSMKK
eukprot:137539_1